MTHIAFWSISLTELEGYPVAAGRAIALDPLVTRRYRAATRKRGDLRGDGVRYVAVLSG